MYDAAIELKTRQVFEDALTLIERLFSEGKADAAQDLITATFVAVKGSVDKIADVTRRKETLDYCQQRLRLLDFPMEMKVTQTTKPIRTGRIPYQPTAAPKVKKYEGLLTYEGGKIPIPHIDY